MKNILIVDDEEGIRGLYELEFQSEGFNTHAVSSGRDAVNYIEQKKPVDLVILDIKMEDMSGLDVLEELRSKSTGVPIILNSAYSTYKNNFTSWLADAYLVKSPDLTELKDKVKELLTF